MKLISYSRLAFLVVLTLSAAGCRNENPNDTQPVGSDPAVVVEGVLIEESVIPPSPQPSPAATDLVIPGAQEAHRKEVAELEWKNTISVEDVQVTLYFGFDRAALSQAEKQDLKILIAKLKKLPGMIVIEGHADERGPASYNKTLGLRRAKAVAGYLEQQGVRKSRIQINSYGSERPVVAGYNEDTWARNRRVELNIISSG